MSTVWRVHCDRCQQLSLLFNAYRSAESARGGAAQVKDNDRYMRSRYLKHMLSGGGLFLLGLFISILSIVKAYSSPSGGYYVVTWGFVIFGGGDFLYGLVGVIGLMRSKKS